ncbi:MAG: hypothetical protein ACJAYU_005425 [Bradymonadia bacterium]|jgi:hypothetical protein
MVAGHFATALVAKRLVPRGHLAFYLVIAQLPDFLWHIFHFAGLEPTSPDNPMMASLDTMHAEMTYSHDLIPTLGWIALVICVGRAIFGSWGPGWAGAALIVVHAMCDAASGHPHYVFGPDTAQLGLGLYGTSPYLAILIELVFTGAVMAWVFRADAKAGIRRSRGTLGVWAAVFVGGIAMLVPNANASLVELTGLGPWSALAGTLMPGLVFTYVGMVGALVWADSRPVTSAVRP